MDRRKIIAVLITLITILTCVEIYRFMQTLPA
ncbi:hypothetical protein CLAC_08595 [Corynebacterium lactis RW2-5]|uniref:Uncharacterized protein n=1 Tax=Corynebacterium lactis RW2-5 TaxID=1408189 RepID=A0A0K2H3I0_9CORY|nr:hypothetical protein CLAC_08595 [Corynebacterium lactis RW2-5]